jgi:N-acyl-D-amino-acid deacylase
VGATQVRRMVLGEENRQPTPEQLGQMKALVLEAMHDGAVGVSTSLIYAPAPFAKTEELIALAAEASRFGGIYATHMRDESGSIIPAIDEALRIGREANIPVEIWHIKVAGKQNWGRMPEVVAKINGPGPMAQMLPPTLMPTPHGPTTSPPSCRPGYTRAAAPRWWSD